MKRDLVFWSLFGWTALPYFLDIKKFHRNAFRTKKVQGILYLAFLCLAGACMVEGYKTLAALCFAAAMFIYIVGFIQIIYFSNGIHGNSRFKNISI